MDEWLRDASEPHGAQQVVHAPNDRRARPNLRTGTVRQLSAEPCRAAARRRAATVLLAAADIIHAALIREHFAESILFGTAFAAMATVQFIVAARL